MRTTVVPSNAGLLQYVQLLARYNQSMNQKIYHRINLTNLHELHQNRGAFFGSIYGTLNHIMVADLIWLHRFSNSSNISNRNNNSRLYNSKDIISTKTTTTTRPTDSTSCTTIQVDKNDTCDNNPDFSVCTNHNRLVRSLQNFLKPTQLDELLYPDLGTFTKKRMELDQIMMDWTHDELPTTNDFLLLQQQSISYQNMKGKYQTKEFGSLLLHFFNHQTHHRGQVTTLLSQLGVDVGVTDLLELIPNVTIEMDE